MHYAFFGLAECREQNYMERDSSCLNVGICSPDLEMSGVPLAVSTDNGTSTVSPPPLKQAATSGWVNPTLNPIASIY